MWRIVYKVYRNVLGPEGIEEDILFVSSVTASSQSFAERETIVQLKHTGYLTAIIDTEQGIRERREGYYVVILSSSEIASYGGDDITKFVGYSDAVINEQLFRRFANLYRRVCRKCGQEQNLYGMSYNDSCGRWESMGAVNDGKCICHKFARSYDNV